MEAIKNNIKNESRLFFLTIQLSWPKKNYFLKNQSGEYSLFCSWVPLPQQTTDVGANYSALPKIPAYVEDKGHFRIWVHKQLHTFYLKIFSQGGKVPISAHLYQGEYSDGINETLCQ